MRRKKSNTRAGPTDGFTLVEVIITVTLIGLLMLPVIGGIFLFYSELAGSNRKASVALETQAAVRSISEELRSSSGLHSNNEITDPNKPFGWATSDDDNVIVVAVPAQDSAHNFIMDSSTGKPYRNEIIYYSDSGILYRRTLPNASAPDNAMIFSCPPTSATNDCPADSILSSKFDDLSLVMYDSSNAITAIPSNARSVTISLSVKDEVYDNKIETTSSVRIAFRNP